MPEHGRSTASAPPTFFGAYGEWMQTPPPTWEDLRWLREQWDGPFMLKGVDARRRRPARRRRRRDRDLGLQPRRQQPRRHARRRSARCPAIAEAVGDEIEILLDGGVRRGSDVVKALALGARAVMIGRAYLWGLAANGQAGVENVLDILRGGIDSALLGLGRASVAELSPADLLIPDGFERGWESPKSSERRRVAGEAWLRTFPELLGRVDILC